MLNLLIKTAWAATNTKTWVPPDFARQIILVIKTFFVIFSPIVVPVIAVGIFGITLRILIRRIFANTEGGGSFLARFARQKVLLGLLVATVSAFLVWLSQQSPELQAGFFFPLQLIYDLIRSHPALSALVTALIGIITTALFVVP